VNKYRSVNRGEGDQVVWSYTVYLTRFRTYKIALPPQSKTYEGRGLQTDKHLPPRFFTGQFLIKADI
jgi:hypothetical protein